ncbi:hypothetical protein WJX79_002588 [Trebouxia sp. C0005]
MTNTKGLPEEPGICLQQLGWVKLTPAAKDDRPIQEFSHILTLEEIQATLSSKREERSASSPLDLSDIADELDSTARRKSKKKTRPLSSALSVKSSRPVQLSAADVAKGAMTLQEPQLLDKMENVAYRLQTQAHERKKRMNSRGVFGEEQNALRARSVQRVQLWKGLHPSALSEAVSHFTKSQKLQNKTSIARSGTMQSRTEKACLDVLSRLDADLPLSAIQGTLDAHASGKLTGSKLDSAMAGLTAEYAARGKLRNLSPEQERSLKLKVLEAQAKRLQQYQERIAQESEAVLLRAETQRAQSNLELLVKSLGEEQAEQSMEARVEERAHLTASGPALLEAVLARIKAAEERLTATRLQRGGAKGAALRAGALAHVTSYLPEEEYIEGPSASGAAALSPKAAAHTQRGVDYEFGKAFDRQDADKYFGGMISVRTKSGHVIFQPAPAKSWESGQRPRTLHPHELPWARTGPLSSSLSPQKSEVPKPLRPSASTVASLDSDASLDAAILAEEEAKQEEAAKTAARIAAAAAQEGHNQSAASILDQAWGGRIALPTREEVAAIPMPELPNLEPPSPRTQFETIAQYLQVRLERVWSILQVPVTAKLDWVIRYTGEEGSDLFEPALQAWEQAAAAVLERERLLGQLSLLQQHLLQPGWLSGTLQQDRDLAAEADRLSICFVIATVQVEAAAQLLQEVFGDNLVYEGVRYPGAQALTLAQLEQFVARVHAQSQ